MTTEESEAAREVRASAREFAEKRLKPSAQKFDEEEAIPRELYSEAASLGFLGIMISEEYGGLGLDYSCYAAAMEELARGNAAFQVGVTVHNSLVASAVSRFGTPEQKERILPRMAKGEWIGAYSLSEPSSGSDAGSLKCAAIPDGDSYKLDGAKAWVTNAGFADLFLVFALTDPAQKKKGISCLVVEKGLPGFSVGKKEKKLGIRASDTRELHFQACRVPKGALLGPEGGGLKVALTQLDNGRISIAAQAVGIAQAAFDEAVSYSKQRQQFGRPISDFQATRFKVAEMALQIEAARLLTARAAAMMGRGEKCGREASMAKLFASQAANRVAFEALQLHGGNGFIREFPVERYFRDARVTEIYEGTTEIQKLIIAREFLGPESR